MKLSIQRHDVKNSNTANAMLLLLVLKVIKENIFLVFQM